MGVVKFIIIALCVHPDNSGLFCTWAFQRFKSSKVKEAAGEAGFQKLESILSRQTALKRLVGNVYRYRLLLTAAAYRIFAMLIISAKTPAAVTLAPAP